MPNRKRKPGDPQAGAHGMHGQSANAQTVNAQASNAQGSNAQTVNAQPADAKQPGCNPICYCCFEMDPMPSQTGCACKGRHIHVECAVQFAMHNMSRKTDIWTHCTVCKNPYSGSLAVQLAAGRLRVADDDVYGFNLNLTTDHERLKTANQERIAAMFGYATALKDNNREEAAINVLKKMLPLQQKFSLDEKARQMQVLTTDVQRLERAGDIDGAAKTNAMITKMTEDVAKVNLHDEMEVNHVIAQCLIQLRKFSEAWDKLVNICAYYRRGNFPSHASSENAVNATIAHINLEICRKEHDGDMAKKYLYLILEHENEKNTPSVKITLPSAFTLAQILLKQGESVEAKAVLENAQARALRGNEGMNLHSTQQMAHMQAAIEKCNVLIANGSGKAHHKPTNDKSLKP